MTLTETPSTLRGRRIDAFLQTGGIVVASTERAAHALRGAYNRRRIAEGLTAWEAPRILEWKSFVREQWDRRPSDGRMVLSVPQEEWLWSKIAAVSQKEATVLHGPRYRIAAMAREAHELICSYAPTLLDPARREKWLGDAEVFSNWLMAFDSACSEQGFLSSARLPLELLKDSSRADNPPLLLVGFDRVVPAQKEFFAAWGEHALLQDDAPPAETHYYVTGDAASELAACALWCRKRLTQDPDARLLVVSQDASLRRGEIERAFARHLDHAASAKPPVEFSLGVPLSHVPLVRGALLLLRWLTKPIAENEVDWLIDSKLSVEGEGEATALARHMRLVRKRQHQRPEWTIEAFLNSHPEESQVPQAWARRLLSASRRLDVPGHKLRFLEWSELLPSLLQEAGWPGCHPMTSANFQALQHWVRAVEICGTLGFDGTPVSWPVFHSALARTVEDILFSPESTDDNILVAGPAQSAGLAADGVWFLGAEEDVWPMSGTTHPFLPLFVQKDEQVGMPHSSTQLDSDLSRTITERLIHSSPEVNFSHARLRGKAEATPSHLVMEFAGAPVVPPSEFVPPLAPPRTESYVDVAQVPLRGTNAVGGAGTLTNQSMCPFKAFAEARLAAVKWDPAETGLSPRQRGDLVHEVLHALWGGPARGGWRSAAELHSLLDTEGPEGVARFVSGHAQTVMEQELPAYLRDRLAVKYVELETQRLTRLITEWLLYEATRASFTVAKTEERTTVVIAGLTLDLRLDRLDTLEDGSSLVIDYKTGIAGPQKWALPRPEDVQLPLYSSFAVAQTPLKDPGGLVFASIRAGNMEFSGRVRQASALLPNLSRSHSLVKDPLNDDLLDRWRDTLNALARDFLDGRAPVDPREYPSTCEHCALQAICRIGENHPG